MLDDRKAVQAWHKEIQQHDIGLLLGETPYLYVPLIVNSASNFMGSAYSLFRLEQQVNQLVAQLLHLVDITIRCYLTNALDHLSQLRRQGGVEVSPV